MGEDGLTLVDEGWVERWQAIERAASLYIKAASSYPKMIPGEDMEVYSGRLEKWVDTLKASQEGIRKALAMPERP